MLVFGLLAQSVRPEPVAIADPCEDRQLPSSGGVAGFAQDAALIAADTVACRAGSSREELVLALADDEGRRGSTSSATASTRGPPSTSRAAATG